jgi:hypothetical protein
LKKKRTKKKEKMKKKRTKKKEKMKSSEITRALWTVGPR